MVPNSTAYTFLIGKFDEWISDKEDEIVLRLQPGFVGSLLFWVVLLNGIQRCLMKSPFCSSDIAWRSCSCVFITMGPYHATGSSIGLPETNKNRIPSSPPGP